MNKNLILLALSMFIWGIGEGMFIFLQPLYLQELGADPIAIGTILSGFSMVMAIAHLPAGYLADKIGRRPLIWLSWGLGILATGRLASVAGLGVAGVSFLASRMEPRLGIILGQLAVGGFAYILWQGSGIAWLAVGYFLLGGYKTARALISAQTSQLVHNSNLGFVFGVTETVGSIATILASLPAGILYQSAATRVYMVSLALIALSILISWRFLPAPHTSHVISLEPSTPLRKD